MEAHVSTSPFVAARLRRRLTLEEAAARAELDVDEVKSLEESRTYVFPSTTAAIAAAVVYAASLGITPREARELAGLPADSIAERWSLRRWLYVFGFVGAVAALVVFVFRPQVFPAEPSPPAPAAAEKPAAAAPPLPRPWEIQVDVFNGSKRGNAASGMANRIAGLAYAIGDVRNAKRHDYPKTRVYYPPGAEAIAARLADELGVTTAALPGGDDDRRLVVIVGGK